MIAECLERERDFGIVWLSDEELKPIGCAVAIERVLERMDDGRVNILTRGTRPFRLIERQDDLAYPAGTVEFLGDREEEPDEEARQAAREAYAALVLEATDSEPDAERLDAMSAYDMAATVEFGLEAKQGLLELRSENARLRLLARLMRAALKRLEFVDRAQARARSNGKVRFG
jgi:Lon protease-like protein